MENMNLQQYRRPNDGQIPSYMSPLMTDEQYKIASEIEAQGYNYSEVAKEYNAQVQQQKSTNDRFFSQFDYTEQIGIDTLYKQGASLNAIQQAYSNAPKKLKAMFRGLGETTINDNREKEKLSQDGIGGALLQNGKTNATQLRTLLSIADHQQGLNNPEVKAKTIAMLNADLGTNIRIDENGKMYDMALDGITKIDLEPGVGDIVRNNAVTLLTSVIAGTKYIGGKVGETLGLRTLTDFYQMGLKNQMKHGAKFGLVTGTFGGLADLVFNADAYAAKHLYLNDEYKDVAQKIIDNPYDKRFENFAMNVAGDVIGGGLGPLAIRGVVEGVKKTSDISMAVANLPQSIVNKYQSLRGVASEISTKYGIMDKAARKVKRTIQPMSKTAEEMNENIANEILKRRQTEATKTLSKLEQTDAFLTESGWTKDELAQLNTLEKLILTNMSTKATAQPMIDQMSKLLGLDDIAKIKQQAKIIAQNQLDSVYELSNAVQNNTLSVTSLIKNMSEFAPNIRTLNNMTATKYNKTLVNLNPNTLGKNLKPALTALAKVNLNAAGGIKKFSHFDNPALDALTLKNTLDVVNATTGNFEANSIMRKTLAFGLNNQGKAFTAQQLQMNLENVGLDDYMKTIIDLEMNAERLKSTIPNLDELINNMKIDLAKYSDANPSLLTDFETMRASAIEANTVNQFFNRHTNLGKAYSKFATEDKSLTALPQLTKAVLTLAKEDNLPDLNLLSKAFGVEAKDLEHNLIKGLVDANIVRDASGKINFDSAKKILKSITDNEKLFVTPEGKALTKQLHNLIEYNQNFIDNVNSLYSKQASAPTSFLATSLGGRLQMFLVSRQWGLLSWLVARFTATDATVMKYTGQQASKMFASGKAVPNNIIKNFKENIGKIIAEPDKIKNVELTQDALMEMVKAGKMEPHEAVNTMKQYGALIDDLRTAHTAFAKAQGWDDRMLQIITNDESFNQYLLTGQLQ